MMTHNEKDSFAFTHILVVEDDRILNRLIQKTLEREGYIVLDAFSAKEAFVILEKHPDIFILLDYVLPDMHAPDFIQHLKNKKIECHFMIMTGFGDEKMAVNMMKKGASDYLVKDSNFLDALVPVIKKIENLVAIEINLKNTNVKLFYSEERFREIFERSYDIIYTMDFKGNFTAVNPSAQRILGHNFEELKNPNMKDFVSEGDLKIAMENISMKLRKEKLHSTYEVEFRKKDGSFASLEINSQIRYMDGNPFEIFGIARDVSERKILAQKKQESINEQLMLSEVATSLVSFRELKDIYHYAGKVIAGLIENAYVFVVSYDTEKKCLKICDEFGLSDFIPKAAKLMGMDPLGFELFVPDLKKENLELLKNNKLEKVTEGLYALSAGKVKKPICMAIEKLMGVKEIYAMGFTWNDKLFGGIAILSKTKGAPEKIKIIESIINQTAVSLQRKFAEDKLVQNEKLYRTLVETSPEGICMIDMKGNILSANEKIHQIFADEERRKNIPEKINIYDSFSSADRKRIEESLRKRLLQKDTGNNIYEAIRTDGMKILVEVNSSLLFDANNTPYAIISVVRNITERMQQEIKLHESEFRFHAVVSNTPDHIIVQDKDLRYTMVVNPQLDLTEEGMLGKTDKEIFRSEEGDTLFELKKNVMKSGKPFGLDTSLKNSKGDTEYFSGTFVPMFDTNGLSSGLIGYFRNNTAVKQAEIELRASEEKYRNLISKMMNAFALHEMIFDEKGEAVDYRFLEVNPVWEKVVGIKAETVIGKTIRDIMPNIEDTWMQLYERVVKTGIPEEFEEFNNATNKYYHVYAYNPEPGKFAVFFNDITEQKQVEITQSFMLKCGLPATGEDFFESLAKYLSLALDMEYICIDRLDGDGLHAETVAVYNDGCLESNVKYALKNTPCGEVVNKNICSFPQGVQQLFPYDEALKELNAESYFGTTLFSSKGKPIGLIALIGHKALNDTKHIESTLKLVTPRAAGELERRTAESEIIERDTIMNLFMKNSPVYVFFKDENIKTVRLSKNFEQMLNMPLENILGKTMDEIFPSDLAKKMIADDKRILNKKETITVDEELNGKFYTTIKFPIIIDGKPKYLAGYTIDITEQKISENKLRESEVKYRALIESSNDAIFCVDKDGYYKFANKIFASTLGFEPEYFIGKSFWDIYPKELADHRFAASSLVFETGQPGEVEVEVPIPEGTLYFLAKTNPIKDEQGNVIFNLTTASDITKRKMAEETLQASKEYLHKIINTVASPIFVKDIDHKFVLINDAFCDMLGLSQQEIIGTTGYEYFPQEQMKVSIAKDQETFITGKEVINEEMLTDGLGIIRTIVTRKTLYIDNAGNKFLVGVFNDITERKKIEQELKIQEERFRQLFENMSSGVAVYTAIDEGSDFILSSFNTTAENIEKIKREEILGKKVTEVFENVKEFGLFSIMQNVWKSGNPQYHPSSHYKDKKNDSWRENYVYKLPSGEIVALYNDVTDKVKAQEVITDSVKRYKSLFEDSPIPIWEEDFSEVKKEIDKLKKEGVKNFEKYFTENPEMVNKLAGLIIVTDINPAVIEFHKVTDRKAFLENIDYVFSELTFRTMLKEFVMIAEGNTCFDLETESTSTDGESKEIIIRWAAAKGHEENLSRVLVSVIDLSEIKKAGRAIRESDEKFRVIFEKSNSAMAIINPDTSISMVNDVYCRMSGFSMEEVAGMNWTKQLPPDDLERMKEYNRLRLADPTKAPDHYEFKFYHKNGEMKYAIVTVAFLPSLNKIITSFTDITERKEAEENLKHSMEELRRFNELTVGREVKMVELKKEINELLVKLGGNEKYKIVE